MEEPVKEQSIVSGNGGSAKPTLLRYSLRSASKSKDQKAESVISSASRRAKASSVSKSVGVLDLSAKDKSAKPPRRLSVPVKSVTPNTKVVGNITPIAETRARRSAMTRPKSDTPLSDVSRSSTRKKFSVLSSASYWLQQIKLSESAAKHSISLGFFKLAKEAGCEPLQKMREELKSYAGRHNHNLTDQRETVKELFESYNIVESPEQQLQVSESFSQVPEEGSRSSDDEVRSSSSSMAERKMKPKSLNTDAALAPKVAEPAKETLKRNPSIKAREPANKNAATSKSVPARKVQKKPQKPVKEEPQMEKEKVKRQGKKPAPEQVTGADVDSPPQDVIENKENMDNQQPEEVSAEVM